MAIESVIMRQIMLAIGSMPGIRVWRNHVGAVQGADGRWHRFGLPGSADIIGIGPGGRFLAIEVKSRSGRQSPEQKRFQAMIESLGGIYILARSVDDVLKALSPPASGDS